MVLFNKITGQKRKTGISCHVFSFQQSLSFVERFVEKKAMALLYKLEETSRQLVAVSREIVALTQKFEREWLRTSM